MDSPLLLDAEACVPQPASPAGVTCCVPGSCPVVLMGFSNWLLQGVLSSPLPATDSFAGAWAALLAACTSCTAATPSIALAREHCTAAGA